MGKMELKIIHCNRKLYIKYFVGLLTFAYLSFKTNVYLKRYCIITVYLVKRFILNAKETKTFKARYMNLSILKMPKKLCEKICALNIIFV